MCCNNYGNAMNIEGTIKNDKTVNSVVMFHRMYDYTPSCNKEWFCTFLNITTTKKVDKENIQRKYTGKSISALSIHQVCSFNLLYLNPLIMSSYFNEKLEYQPSILVTTEEMFVHITKVFIHLKHTYFEALMSESINTLLVLILHLQLGHFDFTPINSANKFLIENFPII